MKKLPRILSLAAAVAALGFSPQARAAENFNVVADRFADVQVLRYRIPGFEDLSLKQKELAYYLYQAGLSGRDIFYDQKYRHNLRIRKTIEAILATFSGDKTSADFRKFEDYAKRFFFANGLHHHYANTKILPEFSPSFFREMLEKTDAAKLPLEKQDVAQFARFLEPILFDPAVDPKEVDLSPGVDHVKASANNFYEGVTEKEVEDFYANLVKTTGNTHISYGLNSKLVKENGEIKEKVWKVGGMYGPALEKIVYWLGKAAGVAENERQKTTIEALIRFYQSGDIADFDKYCISWVKDTESRIDAVNGFIEVYQDALQKRGSFESVVSMRDLEATKRIAAIAGEAQYFEDHSPIMTEHKKKKVTGISAKVITVIGEVGDAAPATPIGINLPNAEWIRETYGSKSVSLGNIVQANNIFQAKSPSIREFGYDAATIERAEKYGPLSRDLHVDMHEVIGHASGQLNPNTPTPDKTLKNYAGTLEEGRADLVALYYALDQKLIDLGLMPSSEVGKAEYDSYILGGLMTQLYRVKPGQNLEEAHMRNRQMVAGWVFEKGGPDKVVEKVVRDGKTYFRFNDYQKLRELFGRLLREVQRIKSEGDYEAGKNLVETYGVKVDQALLTEVHKRYESLNIAPFVGYIQPRLVPVMEGEEIKDVKVEYPASFLEQMLFYGKEYSFLPVGN